MTVRWLINDAIGHVLAMTRNGWNYTLCGKRTPNGIKSDARPARVCRSCRERLREHSRVNEEPINYD